MLTLDIRFQELLLETLEDRARRVASDAMTSATNRYDLGRAAGQHYALTMLVPGLCDEIRERLIKGS